MSHGPVRHLIFIEFLLIMAGCGSRNVVHVASDVSNPKSAALTFLRAMSAGDIRTAKAACIGNKQELAAVESFSSFITGLRAYDQAITKKFYRESIQAN